MSRTIALALAAALIVVTTPASAQDAAQLDDPALQKELEKLVEQKKASGQDGDVMKLDASKLPELQKLLESQLANLDGESGASADATRARAVELWKQIGDTHQSKEALQKAKEAYEKGLELDGELPESMSIGPELEKKLKAVLDELGTSGSGGGIVVEGGDGGGAKVIVIE